MHGMEWRTVTLLVSDTGEVHFLGKRVRPIMSSGLYGAIRLSVHRLVAVAFHGEPPELQNIADHVDGDISNNAPTNLRWTTYQENSNNPRTRFRRKKLSASESEQIVKRHPGNFETLVVLAKKLGISYSRLTQIKYSKTPIKTTSHRNRIISNAGIEEIKNWSAPKDSVSSLAKEFGVSNGTIGYAWRKYLDSK